MNLESESLTVQGKFTDISKRYGKRWSIKPLGNGNGNWLLTRKAELLVNGSSYRGFILNLYGKSKLTERLADRFIDDVESGDIDIDAENGDDD